MSKPYLLRTPTVKSKVGVDRENKMLMGFVVAEVGEAKGHGGRLDETTLALLHDLGNKVDGGSKMRFTHPNMSNDGLGKYLGRAKNFRIEGNQLRADAKLGESSFKTPNGDLGSYVMDLAEEDPEAFGASVAMMADLEEELDDKGKPKKGPDGKPLLPVFRPKKLHAVDVVDQPAATTSMFTSHTWAAQATEFADRLSETLDLTPEEVAAKVQEFLPRYLASKGVVMNDATKQESGAATPPTPETTVDLSADRKAAEKVLEQATLESERVRCSTITAMCSTLGCSELAQGLIDEGLSMLAAQTKAKAHLAAKNPPLPSGVAPETEEKKDDPGKKYRDEFAQLSEVMDIPGDAESYAAMCLAAEKNGGWVKAAPVARKAG